MLKVRKRESVMNPRFLLCITGWIVVLPNEIKKIIMHEEQAR